MELGAAPAVLRQPTGAAVSLAVPGHGAHTWVLALASDRVTVLRDGAIVYTQPIVGSADRTTWASFGQRTSCGRPVGPAARWTAASVTPTAPRSAPHR